MKIAIVGAGSVGKALATSLIHAGNEVALSARDPEHAEAAADATGAKAAPSASMAARDADLVVLAVPYVRAGETVASELAPVVAGKTVVDATNPMSLEGTGLATTGVSGAEHFQDWLPDAKLVKAFNTLFASVLETPSADVEAFVAGDDVEAKAQVLSLVSSMGFAPLDVGPLSAARYLEAMAFLNISLNAANGWSWTSVWKLER